VKKELEHDKNLKHNHRINKESHLKYREINFNPSKFLLFLRHARNNFSAGENALDLVPPLFYDVG